MLPGTPVSLLFGFVTDHSTYIYMYVVLLLKFNNGERLKKERETELHFYIMHLYIMYT